MGNDAQKVRALAEILAEFGLSELTVKDESGVIKLKAERTVKASAEKQQEFTTSTVNEAEVKAPQAAKSESYTEVKSPMVGVLYAAPSQGENPFVAVGSHVKKGATLCIIEAMKLMNEITAPSDCEIAEICVENGGIVEYGQTLFKITV